MAAETLRDLRCPSCGRLLARLGPGQRGVVQVKCTRCGGTTEARGDRIVVVEQGRASPRLPN